MMTMIYDEDNCLHKIVEINKLTRERNRKFINRYKMIIIELKEKVIKQEQK